MKFIYVMKDVPHVYFKILGFIDDFTYENYCENSLNVQDIGCDVLMKKGDTL